MKTSEIPLWTDTPVEGEVIAAVEVSPGVKRLRRVPIENVAGPEGPEGPQGPVGNGALTLAEMDARYVNESGDMMEGALSINGTTVLNTDGSATFATGKILLRDDGFGIFLRHFADDGLSGLAFDKRGTTGDADAALIAGGGLGMIQFRGWDGTDYGVGGSVRMFTSEAWTGSAHGTKLRFITVPTGSTTATTHAELNSISFSLLNGVDLDVGTGVHLDSNGSATFATGALSISSAGAITFPHSVLAYAATTNLDFAAEGYRSLTLAGNVTFTTSNRGAAKVLTIRIIGDGSIRTLTFPVGWKFVGAAAPASLAANKIAILSVTCFGSADTDIVATYSAEP